MCTFKKVRSIIDTRIVSALLNLLTLASVWSANPHLNMLSREAKVRETKTNLLGNTSEACTENYTCTYVEGTLT
jgi:hypothetical protein